MNTYLEHINTAREYARKAGIHFDPYRLARIFSGLNFDRYEILQMIPKGDNAIVIIQRCKDPDTPHYCVQYRGSGKYFGTWPEVVDYYTGRFHDNKLDGLDGTEESIDHKIGGLDNRPLQEAESA